MSVCQLLEWDTQFFGIRIGRVLSDRLTRDDAESAFLWCQEKRIQCLYFLAAPDCRESAEVAAEAGFRLTDVRVTLDRKVEAHFEPGPGVRPYLPSDLTMLKAIAAVSHVDSRFYFDSCFPLERCQALYETWIEKSCHGNAEAVFVAEHESQPMGYITCHVDHMTGSIGLFAIAEQARGRGLGGGLVSAALGCFRGAGCERVTVVTQGRNCAAQRLYQKNGFRTASVKLWFHRWFDHSVD